MNLESQCVLVMGLGASGRAAARLARSHGAHVTLCDTRPAGAFPESFDDLRAEGIDLRFGCEAIPATHFDLAVVSPGLAPTDPLYGSAVEAGMPLLGELEFGWRVANRPTVAVTGTNGKTTTTELITHMLNAAGCPAVAAGNIGRPVSAEALAVGEAERLVLEVSSFQLESATDFSPEAAVLLNLTPDHLDRHGSMADYARIKARIFDRLDADGIAVIQSEALAYLCSLGVKIPGRLLTFSATSRRADFYFEDGLVQSSLPDWQGPLLALCQTRLRGGHNAENVMAALAVGRFLGIPLGQMVQAIGTFQPGAHRCEQVREWNGVTFVNDSKATNLDAMLKAIAATATTESSGPNILLIAGGQGKGGDFHEAGPVLARRVKAAYLLGECRDAMRAAWDLFTTCHLVDDMEEAVRSAVELAESGDVVLLSPACASFDLFTGYAHRGECFKAIVDDLPNTTYGGPLCSSPTRDCGAGKTPSEEYQP